MPAPSPYAVTAVAALTGLDGAQPEVALELDMQRGPAREWVAQEPVQRKIGAVFRKFLRDFRDAGGEYVYRQRMRDMVTSARRPAPRSALRAALRARRPRVSARRQRPRGGRAGARPPMPGAWLSVSVARTAMQNLARARTAQAVSHDNLCSQTRHPNLQPALREPSRDARSRAERPGRPRAGNQQSLHVSYLHLSQAYLDLAVLVPDCPQALLPLFHKTARDAVLADFPEYRGIHEEVFVRITELPVEDSIRELRCGRARKKRRDVAPSCVRALA